MRNPVVEQQYAEALDGLRLLAQRDLLSWWEQTANLAWADQTRLMEEPFAEIVRTYGEQAAYAAADYLFLQRSLSDTLSGLEYPEVADPVGFEQARKSFRWAMNTTRTFEDENGELQADRDAARSKLAGITNRLVASPARKTVEAAVEKAGTKYARVPEPGACPFCLMLASRGAVYTGDTVLKTSNMGSYHDNCVVPGTLVAGPDTVTAYGRHYEGEVVTLVTAGGHELTVTPKHPILTDRGWVAAELVDDTDKIAYSLDGDRAVTGGPYVDQVPTRIEDAVSAFRMMRATSLLRVPGSTEQFHGDGGDAEVDVVSGDHLLWDELHARIHQLLAEPDFAGAPAPGAFLRAACSGLGEGELLGVGPVTAADRIVGRSSIRGSLLRGHPSHPQETGLGAGPFVQTEVIHPPVDHVPGHAVVLAHGQNGFAVGMTTGKVLGDRELVGRRTPVRGQFDARMAERRSEAVLVDAEVGRDLADRLAGFVAFDDLVEKRVSEYAGHVYNLETVEGWYSSNGIITSNCRCLGIESEGEHDLPQINKDLQKEWDEATYDAETGESVPDQERAWNDHINGKRRALQQRTELINARDTGQIDTGLDMGHVTSYRVKKKEIMGGHSADLISQVAAEVKNNVGKVHKDGKTFFPTMSASQLQDWLTGPDGIQSALTNPENIQKNGRWGYWVSATVPSPAGGSVELVVQIGNAKKSSPTRYRVTSVFPRRGDGVKVVLPNGNIEDRRWEDQP